MDTSPTSINLAAVNDAELVRLFALGERAALGELAERHEATLVGLARGLTGSQALAEEAVQDAWVRVIRSAKTFEGRSAVRTWLWRIVINRCRDIAARERKKRRLVAEQSERISAEQAQELRDAVAKLDVELREALLLCHHGELTNKQAADVLGIPEGTLKSRLRRAMARLRTLLDDTKGGTA